jgi:hypothetical protein
MSPPGASALWKCPDCGRRFANRNQTHTCGLHTLEEHFVGRPPIVIETYQALEAAVRDVGEVIVLPEKTRIAFQVRMSFAAAKLRRGWVDAHVVLARRVDNPRFRKVETFSPRNHLHQFRVATPEEVDDEVRAWLREAYAVGAQQHLRT